ncbi:MULTISPECIES: universal stress protein [unclassified Martelella]|uniref:universal stress protein n=1 Tax=unclassified Martelella TaxID=2629616 RepID=UPI0025BC1EF3|nr:universal stress protein [Martelella sp.]|tara:strand:+ start:150 stop:566 length:417 start_codon:yes stop_codon:yes gene_type:complete
MFTKIMVPVDLAHAEKLERGLKAAGDLGKLYGASVVYVGVTSSAPGALGHNPEEYRQKLDAFAKAQQSEHGLTSDIQVVVAHDPAVDINQALARAVDELGCDLVVMATHVPNLADHFMHSHGGQLATHTKASVLLVRG